MKIIIGCEKSQVVCKAFRALGHEAYSCDILPCTGGHPEWHIQDDVVKHLNDGWDMGIFFTPCTFSCNSGVRWLWNRDGTKNADRWLNLERYTLLLRICLYSTIKKVCCENPVPHKYALALIGRRYNQIIQPWMFGHGETKATCLWLKGLDKLKPTNIVSGREHRIHRMPPSKDRGDLRSITFTGIAEAMANQWGNPKPDLLLATSSAMLQSG